jgi:predicted dehydrogenase
VIQTDAACTLSAIVDPSPAAQQWAQQAGVPCYASLDALLRQDRPDGLVLSTPNALHVPQALQCIEAGLPILLEKPVATTVAEGRVLLDAVNRTGAKVLIGHHRAHSAIMAQAQDVVASGQLGTLVAVMGSATFYKPDSYFAYAPWRSQLGGGPILLNLIHEVHNLRMLCGEMVSVQALVSNAVRGFAVEDTAAINFRFANGVLGTFMLSDTAASSRSWEQTSQENKAYPTDKNEDCYVITGTQGSLSIPTMRLKTFPNTQERSWWNPLVESHVELQRQDPLQRQMAHFAAVVRGETEPLVSVHDGLQNLKVTEAILQSARTERVVALA